MLFVRKVLCFIFTFIYIISCPLVILYALGYIYKPVAGQFIQTGVLHISSIPQNADVYLEESHFTNRTPVTISNLLAGTYRITVKKKNYKPWIHDVNIEEGKATALTNILLLPYTWPSKNLTTYSCKDLITVKNSRLFIITTSNELRNFQLYDPDKGLRSLFNQAPFFNLTVKKLKKMTNSDSMIISAGSFLDKKLLYLNFNENEPNTLDITNILKNEPDFEIWQNDRKDIFYRQDKCINVSKIDSNVSISCFLENIKGFGIFDKWLYTIESNNVFTRMTFDLQKQENLSQETFAVKQLFKHSDFYTIDAQNKEAVLFLGAHGDLIVNMPPYYIASDNVLGYKFAQNKKTLVYWTKTSLAFVDFSGNKTGEFFSEGFKIQNLYTGGKDIKQVFWVRDDKHILFNDADNINLLEIFAHEPLHVETISRIKKDTEIFYDDNEKLMFYIDEKSGILKQVVIVPKESIFSN